VTVVNRIKGAAHENKGIRRPGMAHARLLSDMTITQHHIFL
jgi:hypothetical protein